MFARVLYAPEPSAQRRRGGWRQRAAESDSDRETQQPSRLASGLLQDWADGAAQLQRHMPNAATDGIDDPLVTRIATMGENQNAQRGLLRLLSEVGVLDLASPLKNSAWTHAVLLSTWVAYITRNYPGEFRLRFGADPSIIVPFWTRFLANRERQESADQVPHLRGKTAAALQHFNPCAVHEDAGPCSKVLSASRISCFFLAGSRHRACHTLSVR